MTRISLMAALVPLLASIAAPAHAQFNADSLSGFRTDTDEPVKIEANSLEVQDNKKVAIFAGNVVVRQGDVTIRTSRLTVHYSGEVGNAESEQKISKLEATGKVVVKSKDQTATGDWAVFEMKSQIVTLGDNVVLSQGRNVIKGHKLVVDLANGTSKLHGQEGSGRVQMLAIPGSIQQKQDEN